MSTHQFGRPRLGIEHDDESFRCAMERALGSYPCRHWEPGANLSARGLDVVVVEHADSAEQIISASPRATLLCWGRQPHSPEHWTWDGWISRSLDAADAAGVLLELIDSGLLARNHGPQPHPRPTFPK